MKNALSLLVLLLPGIAFPKGGSTQYFKSILDDKEVYCARTSDSLVCSDRQALTFSLAQGLEDDSEDNLNEKFGLYDKNYDPKEATGSGTTRKVFSALWNGTKWVLGIAAVSGAGYMTYRYVFDNEGNAAGYLFDDFAQHVGKQGSLPGQRNHLAAYLDRHKVDNANTAQQRAINFVIPRFANGVKYGSDYVGSIGIVTHAAFSFARTQILKTGIQQVTIPAQIDPTQINFTRIKAMLNTINPFAG